MQPAAGRADDLGQAALDRHVDVLVAGREREAAGLELLRDRVEPLEQRVAILVADDALRGEHAGVRAALLDVVGPEAAVEADRGVQPLEVRVLRLGEARHAAAV